MEMVYYIKLRSKKEVYHFFHTPRRLLSAVYFIGEQICREPSDARTGCRSG